jgi:hypothetical protein
MMSPCILTFRHAPHNAHSMRASSLPDLPIDLRDPATRPAFRQALEALAEGLRAAREREQQADPDPREAAKALVILQDRVRSLASAWARIERLQLRTGTVRQVLSDPSLDWDEMADAVKRLESLAAAVGPAVARFKRTMGSSPSGPRPELGWAIEVFRLWRRYDVKGRLGKRDGDGRFRRFLEAVAEPLGVCLPWTTLHDAIRALERAERARTEEGEADPNEDRKRGPHRPDGRRR